jgi:hypothetical protein
MYLNVTYSKVRIGKHLFHNFLSKAFWNKEALYRHSFAKFFLDTIRKVQEPGGTEIKWVSQLQVYANDYSVSENKDN